MMSRSHFTLQVIIGVLTVLFVLTANIASVSGWSNGGYSSGPANPKYGTHDWIANHALDWLPQSTKQFILDNLNTYLYGTELPDNGAAADGVGDQTKHHVYYFANGLLQEDDSAVRAQQEYDNAVNFFRAGDMVNAAKRLGMMTHYISDLASFGHVMGSKTDWGKADRHSQYEDYVNSRTNNYNGAFNSFLNFDGDWKNISAYDAALALARDTTFSGGRGLTCVWMESNYGWSNSVFVNRCGESLNLAVNLIADVLHAFYVKEAGPEIPISTIVMVFAVIVLVVVILARKKMRKPLMNKKVRER